MKTLKSILIHSIAAAATLSSVRGQISSTQLFGATQVVSNQSTLYQIDASTGQTKALFSFPVSFPLIGQMTFYPPTGQFVFCSAALSSPRLAFLNPLTHSVVEISITGLGSLSAVEGATYYPPLGEFVVTCGPTGTFVQNHLAAVSTNGQVSQIFQTLPFPDADNVVYNPATGLLDIVDLNDTTGVQAVTNPFGSSPTYSSLAPTLNNNYTAAPAVSPDGVIFTSQTLSGPLLKLSGASFVTGASYNPPVTNLTALAYGQIPSLPALTISLADVQLCWLTQTGIVYQLEYRSSLTTNAWTSLGAPFVGDGTTNCVLDSVAGQPQKYYRVTIPQ
jgi:hypothetical protein